MKLFASFIATASLILAMGGMGEAWGQGWNVELVGSINYHPWNMAYDVTVDDSYAYVALDEDGLGIVNIDNPTDPIEVGYYDTQGESRGVAVSGSYAYVADSYGGLPVVNIANPSTPVEVGYYDTPGCAKNVAVSGNYVYIADSYGGLRVVNITNPSAPVEVGYYITSDHAYDVAVSGNYAYVADLSYFEIFDCSAALAVDKQGNNLSPFTFNLLPVYPNPFNSALDIRFEMRDLGPVQLQIYNNQGREVWRLASRISQLGTNRVVWNAGDLPSGIYFVRLSGEGMMQTQKAVLVK